MSDLKDIRQEKLFVNINGQNMQVEYDFNALAYLEEQTGKDRFEFYSTLLEKKLTLKEELYLIHAGLIRNNKIAFEEIGRLKSFKDIIGKVVQAYFAIIAPPEIYQAIYFEEVGNEKKKNQPPINTDGAGS